MATLELKYSADQQHQVDAVAAVTELFRGQEFLHSEFTGEVGAAGTLMEGQVLSVGHANGLRLSPRQLVENLHAIQEENSLPATSVMTDKKLRDFTVEMETGTGKTYVYTRTIFELNKRYGITKFIIVVPSVAIREGVLKSFRSTRKHFATLYDNAPMDVFVYDSKDMGPVGNFATSRSIQVMIINIQAFNRDYSNDGDAESGSLFHRPSERLIGGHSPREVVAECNPIVIIDEPQSVDNTAKAKAAIRSLNPLFVLRYSATHKEGYNKVYRLTPVDAFQQGLVKGICVDSVLAQADLNGAYVRLDSTRMGKTPGSITARLTIDVRQSDGSQKRKPVTVRTGTNLYDQTVSGENSDYEAGWIVSNISAAEGDEWIEFQNGEWLEKGQAVGDVADEAVKRAQIRRTIEDHLQRQLELAPRGIKVLSLFFIDKVERYRLYDPVRNGEYAEMFEQEYADAVSSPRWQKKYAKAGLTLDTDAAAVHSGYFSQDGKGRLKNSTAAAIVAERWLGRRRPPVASPPRTHVAPAPGVSPWVSRRCPAARRRLHASWTARAERSVRSVRMAAVPISERSPRTRDTSTGARAASCPSAGLPEPPDLRLSSVARLLALASLAPSTRAQASENSWWQGSAPGQAWAPGPFCGSVTRPVPSRSKIPTAVPPR